MTEGTETITTIHMLLMAIFALLVVIAIVAGMRKKRGRVQAQREVKAHAEEAGVTDSSSSVEPLAEKMPQAEVQADEPIVAVVAPDGTTIPTAAEVGPVAAQHSPADDPLTQLKGLGPKVAARLGELGIDRVGQLAALDDARAAEIDGELGPFAGRMAHDRWVEQARLLAAGDRDGFERVFGKL